MRSNGQAFNYVATARVLLRDISKILFPDNPSTCPSSNRGTMARGLNEPLGDSLIIPESFRGFLATRSASVVVAAVSAASFLGSTRHWHVHFGCQPKRPSYDRGQRALSADNLVSRKAVGLARRD